MTEGNGDVRALPIGWALTTVKETIKIIDYRGRTPPYSENGIPHLRSSNIRNRKIVWENLRYVSEETYQAYMTRGLPEKGDVLFTTEAPLGEVALAPEQRFSLAQRMMILRPNKDLLLSKFLLYQIENEEFQRKLNKSGTGTTVTGVSSRNFQPTPIILAPINEQNRIVEKIEELSSELDQGMDSLKTAQKQLKVYRQAVLKWAFEGKLTEAWRKQHSSTLKTGEALFAQIKVEREKRYQQQLAEWETAVKEWEAIGKVGKKPTKPQKINDFPIITEEELSDLSDLPNSWNWINFGQLISEGPQNGLYKPASQYGSGTLIVRIDNFYDGKLNNWQTFKRLSINDDELKIYGLKSGDILINRVNSMTHIGKCALIEKMSENCVFESNIMRLKTLENFVHKKFMTYYLSSSAGLKELRKNAKQAVNQASINQTDVCFSRVPICSLIEQEQIVEEIESRLSICDQIEATILENLQKAEALRQSILKQAFEGKLVPQDPNDEPAEKLLEQIKAEKLKQQQSKKLIDKQLNLEIA